MLLEQCNFFPEYYNPGEYLSFEDYLDKQTDNLDFFLNLAAENQSHPIRCCMEGASEGEIEAELQHWRTRQIHRFRARLCQEQEQERWQRHKRKLRRQECRRIQAEDQLSVTQAELQQTKDDLEIERGFTAQLQERGYCRKCYAERWD